MSSAWEITAAEMAEILDCPRSRVYRLLQAGVIPSQKDEGFDRVTHRAEFLRWVRDGRPERQITEDAIASAVARALRELLAEMQPTISLRAVESRPTRMYREAIG